MKYYLLKRGNKMKLKYLGTFVHGINYLESSQDELVDIDEDIVCSWIHIEEGKEFVDNEDMNYVSDEFMRSNSEDMFHGYMGETNTSALVIKINDDCESARIWRNY